MTVARNPFRLRASEQATSDEAFLTLFGPRMLEVLPHEMLWDRLLILSSAPGFGKTTLLRLFTPGVLHRIHQTRDFPERRELVQRLGSLDVLGAHGASVLGFLIDCGEQYAYIEDLRLEESSRLRWFFGLMDARIILTALAGALKMAGLKYPRDVEEIELRSRPGDDVASVIGGGDLYRAARENEEKISRSIDSLRGLDEAEPEGRSRLPSLRLLSATEIFARGVKVAEKVLVMFDDFQALDPVQRRALQEDLEHRDLRVGRWIAHRSQAIAPKELLESARTEGRDFYLCKLEDSARSGFEKLLSDIADRRSRNAEVNFEHFHSCLANTIATDVDSGRLERAASESRDKVYSLMGGMQRFRDWVQTAEQARDGAYDKAVRWRMLAILMERELNRRQLTLDIPMGREELEQREEAGTRTAAQLFLSHEHGLPYYFGASSMSRLASLNTDQFLEIAGDLFDKVVAAATVSMNPDSQLTASQQDAVVRAVSRKRLTGLARDVPHGGDVQRLIQAFGTFCHEETYRPTAPYAPGATGVAISMRDRDILAQYGGADDSGSVRLFHALTSAVAHNVLDARPDKHVKGGEWLVLYLNRIFCPAFELPLQFRGFRERPLKDLVRWLEDGYEPRRQQRLAI